MRGMTISRRRRLLDHFCGASVFRLLLLNSAFGWYAGGFRFFQTESTKFSAHAGKRL
jgi:hypothetical protein